MLSTEFATGAMPLGWLSIKTRKWANEVFAGKAAEELGKALQFRIPIRFDPLEPAN
ncbi:MAG: hypothetical protein WD795_17430 [Woeseia sp.]